MKAQNSSLTLRGWNSVSVEVRRGSDLRHWKLSLGPSNHTICATTQNSAPTSSFIEEVDSIDTLFNIIIGSNICSMSHSSQQKVISCVPHH